VEGYFSGVEVLAIAGFWYEVEAGAATAIVEGFAKAFLVVHPRGCWNTLRNFDVTWGQLSQGGQAAVGTCSSWFVGLGFWKSKKE
jgi:hypothetical protein